MDKSTFSWLAIIAVLSFFAIITVSKCRQLAQEKREEMAKYSGVHNQSGTAVSADVVVHDTITIEKLVQVNRIPLYVCVESLNIRKEPNSGSELIQQVKLYDEVTYLEQTTDYSQEINLGTFTARAPWVKVKTADGRVGWVFGACVSFYKTKID